MSRTWRPTRFEGDAEGDDFEKFITREIEEPGQEAIQRVLGNFKMKPAHWPVDRDATWHVAHDHSRSARATIMAMQTAVHERGRA